MDSYSSDINSLGPYFYSQPLRLLDFGVALFMIPDVNLPYIVERNELSKTKVETPIHDNDLIMTPMIAPQSG